MKIERVRVAKSSQLRKSNLFLAVLVIVTSLVLFFFSSFQLWLFREGNDLGFFAQLLYLLSQGQPPVSTLLAGVHLIGDHGAIILYPLSLLYLIYPDVHWLLAVQAIALACGAIPLYFLSLNSGLSVGSARVVAIAYVFYPAIFNINFFTEFRPETIAVPALLWAVLAAKKRAAGQFAIAIMIVLSCKEVLSLTVIGLGIWLAVCQRRLVYGLGCIGVGLGWFIFAATYLIPRFRGGYQMAGTWQYGSLGTSLTEIAWKVLTKPQILLSRGLASDRLFYYLLLLLPIVIALHWRTFLAIVPALPMLGLNILADSAHQRDLIHQYSLPIIPFLFLWLIASLAYIKQHRQRNWLSRRLLIIWSVITWLALAKYGFFWTNYAALSPNVDAVRGAVNLVVPDDRVLTSGYISPHLSHRLQLLLLNQDITVKRIEELDLNTMLIAKQHLGQDISPQAAAQLIKDLLNSANFALVYQQQDVFLLKKNE